jgi:hypothetical protein
MCWIFFYVFLYQKARYYQRTSQSSGALAINEKALPVTKAHFDSKVEAVIQRSLQVEALLAQLVQTEDNPASVLEDADNDTSNEMITESKLRE